LSEGNQGSRSQSENSRYLFVNTLDTAAARDRAAGEDLGVLLNVDDAGAGNTDGGSGLDGRSTGEGDSAKVGEGDKGGTRLEVLNNPLSVILAEVTLLATGESVCDGSTRSNVLDDSFTSSLGSCGDGSLDGVTSRDADTREVVGVVWVPLIPSIVGDGRSRFGPVDTRLENGSVATVTIDTDPGRSRTSSARGWGSEFTSNLGETSAGKNGTSPVGGVRNIGLVGAGWAINILDWVAVVATGCALLSTCPSHGSPWGGNGRAGEEGGGGDNGELHLD